MSEHDERNDNEGNQADHLMKLFQEVANHTPEDEHVNEVNDKLAQDDHILDETSYVELDILNLPPRREVHESSKVRYSFTFKNPFTRLIVVSLMIAIVLCILFYFDLSKEIFSLFYFIEFIHIIN